LHHLSPSTDVVIPDAAPAFVALRVGDVNAELDKEG
jgi:hypothetical protein